MSISLCCIVNNEQQFIADMLASVDSFADELIVVDTGSTDSTIEIARNAGAKVFQYSWNNHFAEARNYSLERASCDWILVLDADERLEVSDHQRAKKIIEENQGVGIFLQRKHYLQKQNANSFTKIDSSSPYFALGAAGYYSTSDLRLFPRDPKIRFSGAVHESVEDSARTFLKDILYTDLTIQHLGFLLAQERLHKKNIFYLELAKKKLQEDLSDWRNWFQAGAEFENNEQFDQAILHYNRASQLNPDGAESWRQIGICFIALGRFAEGVDFLNKAIQIKPHCAITLNALGVAFKNLGMNSEAIACFEAVLAIEPNNLVCMQNLQSVKQT